MKIKTLLLLLPVLVLASPARASVSIDFNVDSVRNSLGIAVDTTSLGFLVADTAGDGFGTISSGGISVGDYVGSNDLIIYRADFSAFGTPGVWSQTTGALTLSGGWSANDNIAFVWMPTLAISSNSVGAGVSYGLMSNPGVWVTPNDGSQTTIPYQLISTTNNALFTSNDATLSISDLQSNASLTTVPEPSTYALLLTGLGTIYFLRRRRAVA